MTFTVYAEAGNIDRAWPLDLLPRIITASEWEQAEQGLEQRTLALNLFIHDLYNDQRVIKDKIVPAGIIGERLLGQCKEIKPSWEKWGHICGSDIVRNNDGRFYVLEDNLRIPSVVSYMLENRMAINRIFPYLFENYFIHPVDEYPSELFDMLGSFSKTSLSIACLWAMLIARIYEVLDEIHPCISHYVQLSGAQIRSGRICPLVCPQCGGELKIVAFLTEADPIQRLLIHIGEPATSPRIAPARAPPDWLETDFDQTYLNESEQTEPVPGFEFDQTVRW